MTSTTETENAADTTATAPSATESTPAPAPRTQSTVHKPDYEKDVVYLYQFTRCPTLPSISPFCLKVETWLRMTGVKYENVDHRLKYKSKKGQLPFVELNGEEIADSDIIIKELGKHFGSELDSGLTPDQKNISHAFISMLNNHTGWVARCWRYRHPGQFLKAAQMDIKRTLNSKLPKSVLQFFFKLAFKSNVKHAVGHGLGRHTSEEIIEFGKDDLRTLSEYLSDKSYFFGNEPHLLDCVAFAHLCQFVYVPFGGLKEFMDSECLNLISFVERMKERYWSDWDEMCKTLELNTHLPKKVEEIKDKEEISNDKEKEKEKDDEKEEKDTEKEKEVAEEKPKEEEKMEKVEETKETEASKDNSREGTENKE